LLPHASGATIRGDETIAKVVFMTDVMTKQQLIGVLLASGERVTSGVANSSAEDLEPGRYEHGWNGRQILAHIASIEWTHRRLVDLARSAESGPPSAEPPQAETRRASTSPNQPGTHSRSPQIVSFNDRQIEKRAAVPVPDLISEFEANRAATIAAVDAADNAPLAKEITSAGGAQGPLATVLNFVAVLHVLDRLADITGEKK
jgi:hypothetical protein